jgi:formylmethanofuran--tetrahydromethanopterin N-formyltransferase
LQFNGTEIDDTFAEGFTMRFARIVVTAHDSHWLEAALHTVTGYGTSVIGCDAEVGVERRLPPQQTIDGRLGAAVMFFAFSFEALQDVIANRVGQCLLTCPTTAVYDGLPQAPQRAPLGRRLRFFGDGYQKSKVVQQRRYWRIPVMEGEFVVEEDVGLAKGVAGGNIVIQTHMLDAALDATRAAVTAVAELPGVITPFPGGVARSGSKVGSRYKLVASTAEEFCPTLRGRVTSRLHPSANVALEIVINGGSFDEVKTALRVAIGAAAGPDVVAISAGNYGGKLGKHHFHLHDVMGGEFSGQNHH